MYTTSSRQRCGLLSCASVGNKQRSFRSTVPHQEKRSRAATTMGAAATDVPQVRGQNAERTKVVTGGEAASLLDDIDCLVLDCDGVLWHGDSVIDGAAETLQALRETGKRLLFVTNNSSKSSAEYKQKFEKIGLQVERTEIVPTSYTAAAYVADTKADGVTFLIGSTGMQDEFKEAGLQFRTPTDASYITGAEAEEPWCMESFTSLEVPKDISSVVVGIEQDAFTYRMLCYASIAVRENEGCELVATNPDTGDACSTGRFMPGTGCLVKAFELACGKEATIAGKGGEWLLPYLCKKYHVRPEKAAIVGDRLESDIFIGKQGGLRTILTLTGIAKIEDVENTDPKMCPDYIIQRFADLRPQS